jgi:endonuclease/exonuclease/phosphatase family metal-dependent hydrolase
VNGALRANVIKCEVVTSPDSVRHTSDHLPVRMELQS